MAKRTSKKGAFGGAVTGASIGSTFGPVGTAIGAIGGGLMGYFGAPESVDYKFDYKPQNIDYTPDANFMGSTKNLERQSRDMFAKGQSTYGLGQRFLTGTDGYSNLLRGELKKNVGDQASQQSLAMNQMASQRGFGQGNWAGLFQNIANSNSGEQYRKGLLDIAGFGIKSGMGLMDSSKGFYGIGIGAQGQASQNYGQMDSRYQQANMFNAQANNQARMFNMQGNYNVAEGNQNSMDAYNNQWMKTAMYSAGKTDGNYDWSKGRFGEGGIMGGSRGGIMNQLIGDRTSEFGTDEEFGIDTESVDDLYQGEYKRSEDPDSITGGWYRG